MDWKKPQRYEGGAKGSFQESENPAGYCVSFSILENGQRLFVASHRNKAFARLYTDSTDAESMRDFARAMRVVCGFHNNNGGNSSERKPSS